ncbi:MAG TPA: hypothetical protein VFZ86_08485 [Thermoleophilia bacterium]|nr:hypothetical protein [Thermoleophilia bacterium]
MRKVSRAWYWLALAILAAGVLLPAVWGVTSVDGALEKADAFPRAAVPGAVTVTVTDPGDQMIYFTGSGDQSPAALGLRVTDPAGASVPVTPYDLVVKLDLAGDVGVAVATFPAAAEGAYVVTSTGNGAPEGAITVGTNVAMDTLPNVLSALAVMLLSVVTAIAIVIVTLVRGSTRERS